MRQDVEQVLAKTKHISTWSPSIGDFIIWHSWWRNRWYGIIRGINTNNNCVIIVKENLPSLLLSLTPDELNSNSITRNIMKIKRSRAGEYAILQKEVWYIG